MNKYNQEIMCQVSTLLDELNTLMDTATLHNIPIHILFTGIPGHYFIETQQDKVIGSTTSSPQIS